MSFFDLFKSSRKDKRDNNIPMDALDARMPANQPGTDPNPSNTLNTSSASTVNEQISGSLPATNGPSTQNLSDATSISSSDTGISTDPPVIAEPSSPLSVSNNSTHAGNDDVSPADSDNHTNDNMTDSPAFAGANTDANDKATDANSYNNDSTGSESENDSSDNMDATPHDLADSQPRASSGNDSGVSESNPSYSSSTSAAEETHTNQSANTASGNSTSTTSGNNDSQINTDQA